MNPDAIQSKTTCKQFQNNISCIGFVRRFVLREQKLSCNSSFKKIVTYVATHSSNICPKKQDMFLIMRLVGAGNVDITHCLAV